MTNKPIKAGKAYVEAIQGDAAAQEGLERARAKLYAFGKALESMSDLTPLPGRMLQTVLGDAIRISEIGDDAPCDIQELTDKAVADWEHEYGAPYPKTIDDMMRLASEAGLSPDRVLDGEFTFRDVFPVIEGYLKRTRSFRVTAGKTKANSSSGKKSEPRDDPASQRDLPKGITCRKAYDIITQHHEKTKVTMQAMARQLERKGVAVVGRVDGDTRVFDCDQAFDILVKSYEPLNSSTPAARRKETASLKRRFDGACIQVERQV